MSDAPNSYQEEVLNLLRSIDEGIKKLAGSQNGIRSVPGRSSDPKPCFTCPLRENCNTACLTLSEWSERTGQPASAGTKSKWKRAEPR